LSVTDPDVTIVRRAPGSLLQALIALLSQPMVYGVFIPGVTVVNALVGMTLPMLMTPTVFGEYALASTLFQYGLIFDSGISQLADRWIPPALAQQRFEDAEALGQRLMWVRIYIGGLVFALASTALLALAAEGQLPFGLWPGLLSALAGVLYMISLGPGIIYRARSARRNYAFAIGTLGLGLAIARPAGLVAGGLTGSFLALAAWYLAFVCLFHWRMPARLALRPSASAAVSFVLQGLPFAATAFGWAFYVTANRWFASRLMDPADFGHFAFSANIYSLLIGAIGGLSAFYYPRIVGRIASEDRFALSRRITSDFARLTALVGAIMAVGIVLTPTLLAWVYPQYVHSASTARVLLAGVPAMVIVSWLLPISLSSGRRPWIDGLLLYPAATAILYFAIRLLVHHFGEVGVAASSIVSALPLVAMLLFQLRHAHIVTTSAAILLFGASLSVTIGLLGLVGVIL